MDAIGLAKFLSPVSGVFSQKLPCVTELDGELNGE